MNDRSPLVAGVVELVARRMSVRRRSICAPARGTSSEVLARQVTAYLCIVAMELRRGQVAAAIGRDRTTIGHAVAAVEDRRDDPAFDQFITELEEAVAATLVRPAGTAHLPRPVTREMIDAL